MQHDLLLILSKFSFGWLALFGVITVRYFIICGVVHLVIYSILKKFSKKIRLKCKSISWKKINHDIKLSVLCAVIFSFCGTLIITLYVLGFTVIYSRFNQYGYWYLIFSFLVLLLLQDTYYYFVHRLLHHRLLFKKLHYGHHRSGEPTSWTSFAFDPVEAVIQAIFFIAIALFLPIHYITLSAALIVMTIWAVFNHIGWEIFPSSFNAFYFGKWLIGSKHHLIHHRKYRLHYGLYFTFWDNLLGTQDPKYHSDIFWK